MASRGSYTRSAARATFSAYRRLPIRWRLAGGSAVLTFVILAGVRAVVDVLTTAYVGGAFDNEVARHRERAAVGAQAQLGCRRAVTRLRLVARHPPRRLRKRGRGRDPGLRHPPAGLLCTQSRRLYRPVGALPFVSPAFKMPTKPGTFDERLPVGRQARRREGVEPGDAGVRAAALEVDHELDHVRSVPAARRARRHRAGAAGRACDRAARDAADRRADRRRPRDRAHARPDPARSPSPRPTTRSPSLRGRSRGCSARWANARNETEASLARQREFVADASHELRTPLTSVLANLELLAEELGGEQAETANAALRSTRRMRRLVGDLLLLARADAGRVQPRSLDRSRRGPHRRRRRARAGRRRSRAIDRRRSPRSWTASATICTAWCSTCSRTPSGTRRPAPTCSRARRASMGTPSWSWRTTVPASRLSSGRTLFERFVRGGGDGGRGSGLGLAIVRAVATSHGGTVLLESPEQGGTRFVITIPKAGDARRSTRRSNGLRPRRRPAAPSAVAAAGRRRTRRGRRAAPAGAGRSRGRRPSRRG